MVLDLQRVHGSNHRADGHEDVLINKLDVISFVLVRVSVAVNDSHLLDKRALATFTGS